MKKTFKFRINASKTTIQKVEEVINLCRILYNLCLEQRKNAWQFHKKSISANSQKTQLPELKRAFPEFKNVPSQTLQDVVERIDGAFQGFFRRIKAGEKSGYPRFKGSARYDSFTLKQSGWQLNGNHLSIKKIGIFKIKLHRPILGDIKTVIIRRSSSGKWFVCFSCDNVPLNPLPKTGKAIGVDVGCEAFLTDSDGRQIENPRFLKQSEKTLQERQQSLSRKKRGSNRRAKARLLLAKSHEKIRNQRRDFHFKTANELLKANDIVCIEKLKSWKTWRSLNKSMRDAAWINFISVLKGKAVEAVREIREVPAKNTSQICSGCGEIVPKNLSVRIHHCPSCHLNIDRDINAAINILKLGASFRDSVSICPEKPRPSGRGSSRIIIDSERNNAIVDYLSKDGELSFKEELNLGGKHGFRAKQTLTNQSG